MLDYYSFLVLGVHRLSMEYGILQYYGTVEY
jgi:hypothetical protein